VPAVALLGYLFGGPKELGPSPSGLMPRRSHACQRIVKRKFGVDAEAVILCMWDQLSSFADGMSCL
jgi:hypothetical protein